MTSQTSCDVNLTNQSEGAELVRGELATSMDLLGARPEFMEAGSLPRWSASQPDTLPELDPLALPNAHVINPFPVRDDLNSKIALW